MIAYVFFLFLLLTLTLRYSSVFQVKNCSPWVLPIGYAIKLITGFFFLYIYIFHYGVGELTADSKAFLNDSKELNQVFYKSPLDYFRFLFGLDDKQLVLKHLHETTQWDAGSSKWFNDTRNIIRINSVIHFFSFGNIFIHVMMTSFISILGIRLMIVALQPYIKLPIYISFFAILLMPNALFWSASILKEPLIFFSIGLFLYVLLGSFTRQKKTILLTISLLCLVGIKPYILICSIPAIGVFLILKYIQKKSIAWSLILALLISPFVFLLIKPENSIVQKLSDQQYDFNNVGKGGIYARADTCIYIIKPTDIGHLIIDEKNETVILKQRVEGEYLNPSDKFTRYKCIIQPNDQPWKFYFEGEKSGSYIETTPIHNSSIQLIKNIPEAIVNTLFRPFPSDPPNSIYKWFSFFDAWFYHLIFLVTLTFFRKKLSQKETHLIIAFTIFALLLTLLIGWTTPVLGAIIRYKIPVQLALMFITLIVFDPQKIKKWLITFSSPAQLQDSEKHVHKNSHTKDMI